MKPFFAILAIAVVFLASPPLAAEEWTYVYGGVDDPTNYANGWEALGSGPAPDWDLDTGDGYKAIKIWFDDATPAKYKSYVKAVDSSGSACVFQVRFKIVGGQAVAGNKPHFWLMKWHDGRSRMCRRSDALGGPPDAFVDPDNPVSPVTKGVASPVRAIAAYDSDWHTYTVVMVDDDDPMAGSYAYWDGHFAHYRQGKLTGDDNRVYFGIVTETQPAGYPDVEFWADYLAWGLPAGSDLSAWGDPVRDSGTCTAAAATVLTDSTKNWTPGAFAGERLVVGTPGQPPTTGITYYFNQYRILTNTATTITIQSGNMITDGVEAGNAYRICREALGSLPPLNRDQHNAGNSIKNAEFDDDTIGSMQPNGYKCYPAISPPPAFPEWAVRKFYTFDSKPHRTNRMYGGALLGDAESEARNWYIYQTYTTRVPGDPLPATFYASACALTLSEGGTPDNSRVRVGIGKNLLSEDDPLDPAIVWGDWVSTQGYPWQLTPSAQVESGVAGDKLTTFVHLNQQVEYEGKYNLTAVDSVWLNTKPYPLISNIRLYPTNAGSTGFRVQWDTTSPGTSGVWLYGYVDDRTRWVYGPEGVASHVVDLTDVLQSCTYEYEVKTDEVVASNDSDDESGKFRTGPDIKTPVITSGPTYNAATATVIWDTDVPTKARVDFEPRGVGDLKTSRWLYEDLTETTHHEAVLTDPARVTPGAGEAPIAPGDTIWFRVRGDNSSGYQTCVSAWQGQHDFHTARFQWNPVPFTGDIGDIRNQPDGTLVRCMGKTVTGFFELVGATSVYTFFYIEEFNRSAGIKVQYDGYVVEGTVVDVEGILHTVNGEKQITATSVNTLGGETPPDSVGMTNRTICAPYAAQGAAAQGMLAAVWGNVTWVDALNSFFYLEDGTAYLDGTTHNAGGGDMQPNQGLRVYCAYPPPELQVGKYVIVPKGCVGRTSDAGTAIPVVWMQTDWSPIVLP